MKKFVAAIMAALMMVAVWTAPFSAVGQAIKDKSFPEQRIELTDAQLNTVAGGTGDGACFAAGVLVGATFFVPGGQIFAGYAAFAVAVCLAH